MGGGSDGRGISRSGRALRGRTCNSRVAVVIRSGSSGSRNMGCSIVVVLNNRRYLIVLSAIM